MATTLDSGIVRSDTFYVSNRIIDVSGTLYCVTSDDLSAVVQVYKSSGGTAGTWSKVGTDWSVPNLSRGMMAAILVGTEIHIIASTIVSGMAGFDITREHRRFQTSNDTWAAAGTTAVASGSHDEASPFPVRTGISLSWRDSDSTLILMAGDADEAVMGGAFRRVSYWTWTSGGGWSAATALDAGGEIHYMAVNAATHDSTDRTLFYWIQDDSASNRGPQWRALDSSDTLGTVQTASHAPTNFFLYPNTCTMSAYTYSGSHYFMITVANFTAFDVARFPANTQTPAATTYNHGSMDTKQLLAWDDTNERMYAFDSQDWPQDVLYSDDNGATWTAGDDPSPTYDLTINRQNILHNRSVSSSNRSSVSDFSNVNGSIRVYMTGVIDSTDATYPYDVQAWTYEIQAVGGATATDGAEFGDTLSTRYDISTSASDGINLGENIQTAWITDFPADKVQFGDSVVGTVDSGTVTPVPAASANFSGQAPTAVAPLTISTAPGGLSISGEASTVVTIKIIEIPSGSATLSGQSPTALAPETVSVPNAALSKSGQIPTVDIPTGLNIEVPAGTLTFFGAYPSVPVTSISATLWEAYQVSNSDQLQGPGQACWHGAETSGDAFGSMAMDHPSYHFVHNGTLYRVDTESGRSASQRTNNTWTVNVYKSTNANLIGARTWQLEDSLTIASGYPNNETGLGSWGVAYTGTHVYMALNGEISTPAPYNSDDEFTFSRWVKFDLSTGSFGSVNVLLGDGDSSNSRGIRITSFRYNANHNKIYYTRARYYTNMGGSRYGHEYTTFNAATETWDTGWTTLDNGGDSWLLLGGPSEAGGNQYYLLRESADTDSSGQALNWDLIQINSSGTRTSYSFSNATGPFSPGHTNPSDRDYSSSLVYTYQGTTHIGAFWQQSATSTSGIFRRIDNVDTTPTSTTEVVPPDPAAGGQVMQLLQPEPDILEIWCVSGSSGSYDSLKTQSTDNGATWSAWTTALNTPFGSLLPSEYRRTQPVVDPTATSTGKYRADAYYATSSPGSTSFADLQYISIHSGIPSGSAVFTGHAVTLDIAASGSTFSPPQGSAALTGASPTIVVPVTIGVTNQTLNFVTYAPTADVVVPIPIVAITLTGLAPTTLESVDISVPVGSLVSSGQVPVSIAPNAIPVPVASATLSGHAPTTTVAGSVNVETPTGTLTFFGPYPSAIPTVGGSSPKYFSRQIPSTVTLDNLSMFTGQTGGLTQTSLSYPGEGTNQKAFLHNGNIYHVMVERNNPLYTDANFEVDVYKNTTGLKDTPSFSLMDGLNIPSTVVAGETRNATWTAAYDGSDIYIVLIGEIDGQGGGSPPPEAVARWCKFDLATESFEDLGTNEFWLSMTGDGDSAGTKAPVAISLSYNANHNKLYFVRGRVYTDMGSNRYGVEYIRFDIATAAWDTAWTALDPGGDNKWWLISGGHDTGTTQRFVLVPGENGGSFTAYSNDYEVCTVDSAGTFTRTNLIVSNNVRLQGNQETLNSSNIDYSSSITYQYQGTSYIGFCNDTNDAGKFGFHRIENLSTTVTNGTSVNIDDPPAAGKASLLLVQTDTDTLSIFCNRNDNKIYRTDSTDNGATWGTWTALDIDSMSYSGTSTITSLVDRSTDGDRRSDYFVVAFGDDDSYVLNLGSGVPAGSSTFTGHAVTLDIASSGTVFSPPQGSAALTGASPTVLLPVTIGVTNQTLNFVTYAPTADVVVPIPTVAITITGNPSQVLAPELVTVPTVGMVTGTAPPTAVAPYNLEVPVASITLTGLAPTALESFDISVPVGSLVSSGQVPVSIAPNAIPVPVSSTTLSGQAPTAVAPETVDVPSGTATLSGQVPTAVAPETVDVPIATLTFTGLDPDADESGIVATGSLSFTGYAPTADEAGIVPVGSATLSGLAPTVVAPNTIPVPNTRTVYFSDDFNRADEDLDASADWETPTNVGQLVVTSNGVRPKNVGGENRLGRVTEAAYNFSADQGARLLIREGLNSFDFMGPAVRLSGDGNGYVLRVDGGSFSDRTVYRIDNGVLVGIGFGTVASANGDVFALEAEGDQIRLWRNGQVVNTVTDSTHSTGQPGIFADREDTPATTVDDFEAYEIGVIADTQVPIVLSPETVDTPTGTLTITGYAPTLTKTVSVATATVTLTGQTPTALAPETVTPYVAKTFTGQPRNSGWETVGGSGFSLGANQARFLAGTQQPYQATLDSLTFYTAEANSDVRVALYEATTNSPTTANLVTDFGVVTPSAGSWNTVPANGEVLIAGRYYWIAVKSSHSGGSVFLRRSNSQDESSSEQVTRIYTITSEDASETDPWDASPTSVVNSNDVSTSSYLTFTGDTAPTVLSPETVDVASAALSLTGYAPNTLVPEIVEVPLGTLTLTGQAPTAVAPYAIGVPFVAVTLTGLDPDADESGIVATGSLSFVGYAPTADESGIVPVGTATLTGFTPTVVAPEDIAVPAGSTSLVGEQPLVVAPETVVVPQTAVTLSGLVPTANESLTVPTGSLAISGEIPTVLAPETVQIPTATLSITGATPTAVAPYVIGVPPAALTVTGLDPDADESGIVPTGALSFTGYVPTADESGVVPAGSLTITGLAPTVLAPETIVIPEAGLTLTGLDPDADESGIVATGTLTFTGYAPTADESGIVPTGSLTLNGLAPTALAPETVVVPTTNLSLLGSTVTVIAPETVDVPSGTLVITGNGPVAVAPENIEVPSAGLTLVGLDPDADESGIVATGSLSFVGYAPTADEAGIVPVGSAILTGGTPTTVAPENRPVPASTLLTASFAPVVDNPVLVDVPTASITLTSETPTLDQNIVVAEDALTIVGAVPTIIAPEVRPVPVAVLTLSVQTPQVALGPFTVTVGLQTLTLTGTTSTAALGPLTLVPDSDALTLNTFAPTLDVEANVWVDVPSGSITTNSFPPDADEYVVVPTGALATTKFAPIPITPVPTATSELTGLAPTAIAPETVAVPVGTLNFAGSLPTTFEGVPIPVGSTTLTTYSVTLPVFVEVPTGTLTTATSTPVVVAPETVPVPTAGLAATGLVPTLDELVIVPTGTLSLGTSAPSITAPEVRPVPTAALLLTAQTPTAALGPITVEVGSAVLTLSGATPTIALGPITIDVAIDTLNLTGSAPTVDTTANIWLDVPSGSAVFTAFPPDADAYVIPQTGTLVTTKFPPQVIAPIPTAAAVFATYAPTLLQTIDVPTTSLALTGTVPSTFEGVPVGVGAATFSTSEPQVQITVPVSSTALNLATHQPSVDAPYNVSVGEATLAFNTFAVSLLEEVPVGADSVTITGFAPQVSAPENRPVPSVGTILTGFAPEAKLGPLTVTPSADSLSLVGQSPTTALGPLTIEVGTGVATFSLYIPTIDVPANVWVVPNTGSALFLSFPPDADKYVLPPLGTATFTTFAPTPVTPIPEGSVTILGATPTALAPENVQVPSGNLTFTGLVPSAPEGVPIPSGTGVLSSSAPTLLQTIEIGTGSLTLTGLNTTADVPYVVPVSTDTLTVTGIAPQVFAPETREVPTGVLSLSGQAPVTDTDLTIPSGSSTFTSAIPTVDNPLTIFGNTGVISITGHEPVLNSSVPVDSESLSLTTSVPTIDNPVVVSVGTGTLTFISFVPDGGESYAVPLGAMSFTGHPPLRSIFGQGAATLPELTLTSSGSVLVTGDLASTIEITAVGSGTVGVTGNSAATIQITSAGSGNVLVEGTASTPFTVTSQSSGQVLVTGDSDSTLTITATSSGKVVVTGTLTETLGPITLTATGQNVVSGTGTNSLTIDLTASGAVQVTGQGTNSLALSSTAAGQVIVTGQSTAQLPEIQSTGTGYGGTVTGTGAGILPTLLLTASGRAFTFDVSGGYVILIDPAGPRTGGTTPGGDISGGVNPSGSTSSVRRLGPLDPGN